MTGKNTSDPKAIRERAEKINVIGDVQGTDIRITQIYAPVGAYLVPEAFIRSATAAPFSAEWLIFSQQSIPLIGREQEQAAMLRFLNDPAAFTWWAITGGGGHGKSRFALDFLDALPEGWEGGFMPQQSLTVRDASAWQPRGNMLWIIDDAASAGAELRHIIATWAALYCDGPYKLRLLLLERGYNDTVGWWAELTQDLSPRSVAVKGTLYKSPLSLPPLGGQTEGFLTALRDKLDPADSKQLEIALTALGEETILELTQGGNPLLLMLLAAELLSDSATKGGLSIDTGTLAERHFARELDLLKARCDAAQLRFSVMLELLFLTTSCAPINLLLEHDMLFLPVGESILLFTDEQGKYRVPTVAELRAANIGVDVDSLKQPMLNSINSVLEIDDVQAYLSVLDETGLCPYRYAIQPDLIGAVLLNLIFNSPEISDNLKRRRGEFSAARTMRLIDGAIKISEHGAWSAWARLSDRTLTKLISYMREHGKSIRWPMLVTRELNRRRNSKVPFDTDQLLAPNSRHPDAPEVGRYFAALREAISYEMIDDAEVQALGASRHCWAATYVNSLLDLSDFEQLQLCLVICAATDASVLGRLTNLANFLDFIDSTLSGAAARLGEGQLSDAERFACDRVVDALFDFAATRAWPTIAGVDDRSFHELYHAFARSLTVASYFVANQLRGHEESVETRREALVALELARLALVVAPSPSDLQYVDRNSTILRTHEVEDPSEASLLYLEAINAMQPYADAKAYTGAIEDLLFLSFTRSAPHILETLLTILESAPSDLVICEKLIWRVWDQLTAENGSGGTIDPALEWRLASSFLRYFSDQLRTTEDAEAANGVAALATHVANLAVTDVLQEEAVQLLADWHSSLEERPPSIVFLSSFLKGVHSIHHILRRRQSAAEARMPFETMFQTIYKADLEAVVENDAERAELEKLASFDIAQTVFHLAGHVVVCTGIMMELAPGASRRDMATIEPLCQRFIRSAASSAIANPKVSVPSTSPTD